MIKTTQGGLGTGRVWVHAKCTTCGAGVFQGGARELPPPLDPFQGLMRRMADAADQHVCNPAEIMIEEFRKRHPDRVTTFREPK